MKIFGEIIYYGKILQNISEIVEIKININNNLIIVEEIN